MKYSILFILILISCDSFFPREPEVPKNIETNFQRPDNPNVVVNNLLSSFTNKNTVNFLRCFQDDLNNDDFEFIPTQDIIAINPTFFNNWSIKQEEIFLITLFNSMDKGVLPSLTLSNQKINVNPRSAIFEADYYIKVQQSKIEDAEVEYKGKLIFNLVSTTEDYWYIQKWQDLNIENSDFPTWTKLKFNFGK